MSMMHWIVVALVVMLLFGRGKISDLMGDFAKGIRSFKKGLSEDDDVSSPPRNVDHQPSVKAADPIRDSEQPKL
jgi:sec-independent protein translocase protein TatA